MTNRDAYLATFLAAEDFPSGFKLMQDDRVRGPDPSDTAFARLGGLLSGLARWAPDDPVHAPINRVIDIRWLFPTAAAATSYHRATLQANAEGMPLVPGAPAAGADCHAFRWDLGRQAAQLFGGYEPAYTCMYLFTVGPVVVKLFAAGNGEHPTIAETYALAGRIPHRVAGALGLSVEPARGAGALGPDKRPWWRRLFS